MTFTLTGKNLWTAHDGLDTYEIIWDWSRKVFCCFKNERIWIATRDTLEDAMLGCKAEALHQEWASNNPENAERNRLARERRRAAGKLKPERKRRPSLYRGD